MGRRFFTEQMRRFCREYMVSANGKEAAINAGYSPKGAKVRACKLLKREDVQEYLSELREKAEARKIAEHKECCEVLSEIIRARMIQALDDAGQLSVAGLERLAITPALQEFTIEDDGKMKVKLRDPVKAIARLSKMRGYDVPLKAETKEETVVRYQMVDAEEMENEDAEEEEEEEE